MWTCPNVYEGEFSGERYTKAKKITPQNADHEAELEKAEKAGSMEDHLKCFVSCNSKGTNKYRFRRALAYCCDIWYNPMVSGFFTDGNEKRRLAGLPPVVLDTDMLTLSCLIQWMYRSRVRSGLPINIYIPSKRIRALFLKWLNTDDWRPIL